MSTLPISFVLSLADERVMSHYDSHIVRRLSSMAGYYLDQDAYAALLANEDSILYEVYGLDRPALSGELSSGITRLYPGKVGQEYFMTKGHFHAVLETGEIYYALRGTGMMVMETPEGESRAESFAAGQVVYVPPRWAHRTVNVGTEDLLFFWVFPAHAGHDYGTIEKQGFQKLVVATEGVPTIIENPRWRSREGS
jgi:glucose-6-phosphate isomerase, archaeal